MSIAAVRSEAGQGGQQGGGVPVPNSGVDDAAVVDGVYLGELYPSFAIWVVLEGDAVKAVEGNGPIVAQGVDGAAAEVNVSFGVDGA